MAEPLVAVCVGLFGSSGFVRARQGSSGSVPRSLGRFLQVAKGSDDMQRAEFTLFGIVYFVCTVADYMDARPGG